MSELKNVVVDNRYKDYLYYAKTSDGSTIKVLIDTFCKQLCKIEFNLTPNGIFSQMMNGKDKNNMLYDLELQRNNFEEYHCEHDHICVGLNSVHTQDQTYSVKKKYTVIIFIEKANPDLFYIEVIPQLNGEQRRKKGFVTIQKIQYKEIPLPQNYCDPILIESSDYHRMCKDISRTHSKKIVMDVGHGWIRFRGETREITGCDFIFGTQQSDEVLFTQTYECTTLNNTIKAASMSKQKVKVYAGNHEGIHRPLKLSFRAGGLGRLDIYIKCEELITYENESISDDSDSDNSEYSDDE